MLWIEAHKLQLLSWYFEYLKALMQGDLTTEQRILQMNSINGLLEYLLAQIQLSQKGGPDVSGSNAAPAVHQACDCG